MDSWKGTPCYILNFNNLDRGFRRLIEWLRSAGMENLMVIDNHSTWPPLLDYYKTLTDVQMMMLPENEGHDIFWKRGYHVTQPTRFIVTDPDVVPAEGCPKDLVLKMHMVADRIPGSKVGPGIRIDNLPDSYDLKDLMLRSECGYWDERARTPQGDGFFAGIDTTMALYEPGAGKWQGVHTRLDFPYVVEHVPWYIPTDEPHAERDFYKATVLPGISHSQ
jgi:hypothetical protein